VLEVGADNIASQLQYETKLGMQSKLVITTYHKGALFASAV
jgi:hypothetical protein